MSDSINESSSSQSQESSSQSDESQQLGQEAAAEGQEKPLTPAEVKKYKKLQLKFNGKDIEEDLDFEVDDKQREWMTKQRQKAMLADHKAREYAQLENEVGAFIQELRKNPKKALQNPAIGLDIKELAASILQEEIERSQKTPEQLRAEEAEQKLQDLMEERAREKKELEEKQMELLTEREYERYDTLISDAIESSDLPRSPYVVKKMLEYMIMAVENNIDVDPKNVVSIVRNEIHEDVSQMFGKMPIELIEQLVGKETIGKFGKKKAVAPKPPVPVKSGVRDVAQSTEPKKQVQKKQTVRDFFGV